MTSVADNLDGNLDPISPDTQGLWGGLLVLGNAPCSFEGDVDEAQIRVYLQMILLVFMEAIIHLIILV